MVKARWILLYLTKLRKLDRRKNILKSKERKFESFLFLLDDNILKYTLIYIHR
jgi:hypothetical protein